MCVLLRSIHVRGMYTFLYRAMRVCSQASPSHLLHTEYDLSVPDWIISDFKD